MPTNLYGPNDNFDLASSHVLPALIRKFHDAKVEGRLEVTIWGTGTPRREFLHVDDLADACLFLMRHYDGGHAHQRRDGRGPDHPRAGGDGPRDRASGGRHRPGHEQARRHAAQAARREPPARAGLAAPHPAARRDRLVLRVVPAALREPCSRAGPLRRAPPRRPDSRRRALVQAVDHVLVLLLDHPPLDLEGRRQLARLQRELPRAGARSLDALELREVLRQGRRSCWS